MCADRPLCSMGPKSVVASAVFPRPRCGECGAVGDEILHLVELLSDIVLRVLDLDVDA
jgi:hypothetical protein